MHYRIVAKRWFQPTYGNTYHSVAVYKVEGEGSEYKETCLGYAPFQYGYGEQYLMTALGILQNAGVYEKTGKRGPNGSSADYNAFMDEMREHRERFAVFVSDVARKKDL